MRAAKAEWDCRPDAFWPRSTMQVEAAFATNRLSSSVTVHFHTRIRSCGEPCLPDRAKEIDFQFDRSERFLRREGARKCNAHRGISNITKNPAVQCSHGIRVLRSGGQDDGRPSLSNVFRLKSNQTGDWNVVCFCPLHKVRLRA